MASLKPSTWEEFRLAISCPSEAVYGCQDADFISEAPSEL